MLVLLTFANQHQTESKAEAYVIVFPGNIQIIVVLESSSIMTNVMSVHPDDSWIWQ